MKSSFYEGLSAEGKEQYRKAFGPFNFDELAKVFLAVVMLVAAIAAMWVGTTTGTITGVVLLVWGNNLSNTFVLDRKIAALEFEQRVVAKKLLEVIVKSKEV